MCLSRIKFPACSTQSRHWVTKHAGRAPTQQGLPTPALYLSRTRKSHQKVYNSFIDCQLKFGLYKCWLRAKKNPK